MNAIKRFEKHLMFITEIDKLKSVIRNTLLLNNSKLENDAEHSWHISISAIILLEYANNQNLDVLKCIKMLLIHDLVEIDAGDTFAYDEKANQDKFEKESKAADRIFGILPDDQKIEFKNLWIEFEKNLSDEAKYAHTIDSFLPILHNYKTQGKQWKKFGVTPDKVLERNSFIKKGSITIWAYIEKIVEESTKSGFLTV